jgi:hypothetical protein
LTPFQVVFRPERHCEEPDSTYNSFAWLDCGDGPFGVRFNAYSYSGMIAFYGYIASCADALIGDNASALVPAFDRLVDTPHTIESVKSWLQSCICNATSKDFQPTRLVDIGTDGCSQSIKIVETDALDASAYICLSYCWGGALPIICNVQNREVSGVWEISLQALGQTFLDAIKITRQLDFRYLWIDSLCILQDNPFDREMEISRMAQIYQNAALTICASTAEHPSVGFMEPRPDFSENQLQLRMSNGQWGTIYLDRIFWSLPPVKEPLGTRAWALQERILSPRLLEYGWRTARWTCECTKQYSGFTMIPIHDCGETAGYTPAQFNLYDSLNPLGIRSIAKSRSELFECWARIVWRYSSLELTYPGDKLAAISGVAIVLQEITGVKYLAGLWDYERLPSLLQWRVRHPPMNLSSRPISGRAPSWSWAAVDDSVEIMQSPIINDRFEVLDLKGSGVFGISSTASVKVKGPVRTGTWWCENWTLEAKLFAELTTFTHPDLELTIWPDCLGEIFFVDHGEAVIVSQELTFFCIGRAYRYRERIRGLVLTMDNARYYRRVGFFEMQESVAFPVHGWEVKTMHIL